MRRTVAALLLGASTTLLSGCNVSRLICGAEEERAVTTNTDPSFTYTRATGGAPVQLTLISRRTEADMGQTAFNALFRAVDDGATLVGGVILSLSGDDPANGELVGLALALPTPLRRGATYTVGRAFQVPFGDSAGSFLRPRPLADPTRAEVAFSTATYHFPPPEYRTGFAATQASGTVRVTGRYGEGFPLELDLTLTDSAGRVARLQGRFSVHSERYTPPCT